MCELIVAGFEDGHSAFLARAALARLEKELPISGCDVAVVSRGEEGDVTLREDVELNGRIALHEAFWKTLVDILFFPDLPASAETSLGRLAAIGIDEQFIADTEKTVAPGSSAILIVVSPATRDRVQGVLRGCGGKTRRIRLIGEDRKQWLARLSGGQAGETGEQERGA